MSDKRVVIALGGNAAYPPTIRGTAEEQLDVMAALCEHFVRMIEAGYKLILTHGNGPVVGNILFRMARTARELPPMPMDVCVAHSQGGMGYMLEQSLTNVLKRRGCFAKVAAVLTEVEVDAADPAFGNPTKPVGRFFTAEEAAAMAAETGWVFQEDSGRGWRRVVSSPLPRDPRSRGHRGAAGSRHHSHRRRRRRHPRHSRRRGLPPWRGGRDRQGPHLGDAGRADRRRRLHHAHRR